MEGRAAGNQNQIDLDYEAFKSLLDLWSKENPTKTTKLQVLLAVNALLISAVNVSGGLARTKWFLYLAAAIFCLIWTLSIGRTALFQDVWQIKIAALQRKYPNDPRFSILETAKEQKEARWLLRTFGAVPSKWYLLFSPFVFAIAWLTMLVISLLG
jgi:hypothetical protein